MVSCWTESSPKFTRIPITSIPPLNVIDNVLEHFLVSFNLQTTKHRITLLVKLKVIIETFKIQNKLLEIR